MNKTIVLTIMVFGIMLGGSIVLSFTHLSHPHLSSIFAPSPTATPLFFDQNDYPVGHISSDAIVVSKDSAQIYGTYRLATFTDTKSMEPVFGYNNHALVRDVARPEELAVGDIIAFYADGVDYPVVHRIIHLGVDDDGWYAVTKGDNVVMPDSNVVRFDAVHSVVVGVFY